jgi:transposase-like protein
LHRCFQRHDISRLPNVEGDKPRRSKFRAYPIGYFHIDIAEVRTEQGKLYMFVGIDRTSKFAFVELHEKAKTSTARDFLHRLIAAVPYKVHTVLTDNGIHFTTPGAGGSAVPLIKEAIANGELFRAHAFELACARNDIDHRTTKPRHPWTNGQVERMNRTIKEATVKRFYYQTHDELRGTSPTSSLPTTSPSASRPSRVSLPTSSSANAGQTSLSASHQIRTIKSRDQTSNRIITLFHAVEHDQTFDGHRPGPPRSFVRSRSSGSRWKSRAC